MQTFEMYQPTADVADSESFVMKTPKPPRKKTTASPRLQGKMRGRRLRKSVGNLSNAEVKKLVHDLELHQVELETQNEELRQAQVDLAETCNRFSNLYDFSPVGYLTLDNEGIILEANLTAAKMFGVIRQKLLGQKFGHFVARDSQGTFFLHRKEVFVRGHVHACDLLVRRDDGSLFSARLEASPFTDAAQARCCHAALMDMTAVQQAEAAQRASEEQYRLLFELNPNPMLVFDERTLKILAVNAAAVEHYGWSQDEFLQMTAKDIRPPEEVPRLIRILRSQRGSRAANAGEWRHWKKDGTVFDVEVTVSCIHFQGHKARLTMIKDITKRRRAETALHELNSVLEHRVTERTAELSETNKRLRAIMDSVQIGIVIFDSNELIESVNPAALRIFGYEAGELSGLKFSRVIDSPKPTQHEGILPSDAKNGEQAFAGTIREVQGRRKDGSLLRIEMSLAESMHDGKRQFVAMVNDVTERKRLEREVLEVGEGERLRLGQDLHDSLGQQLHGISYMVALFRDELRKESPAQAQEVDRLARHLDHAIELTRGLARGLQPVSPVPEGLMQTLKELARSTRELFRIDCRFECHSPVLIQRHSAASHLYRIAQEAVNNALKHGKPTRIRIKLTATPQQIVLGIRNNGKRFRRRSHKNLGLGLHIMQHRANAIGGFLEVRKRLEGGTEVVCTVSSQEMFPSNDESA
jgi:PAS domain S-box-containing protein